MMRLLKRKPDRNDFELVTFGTDDLPPYAILSHTWTEGQEVTYDELRAGVGKGKTGYAKIRFCGERAAHDGLQYFWVDTCCINKSNRGELREAIASMFRWYRRAAKCYVYLSDVSQRRREGSNKHTASTQEQAFRKSRWFTRGWTLQELLAPMSVEFFSKEGSRLGDKQHLKQQIHEITGLPLPVLQGGHLYQFSVNERMSWTETRRTTLEEDLAYSLLGIFDVNIPLHYGEGKVNAFARLRQEIDKLDKCIQDLHITNPLSDKKRIEGTKGGLLEDSYRWILDNLDFQTWRSDQQSRLLWVKGDPGKGKTMLLCGIINELHKSIAQTALLAYFFCQATDLRINSATSVLRGLIYMLVSQQPSLISHIQKKYDRAGKTVFDDANAWVALSEIFTDIIQDPTLSTTYLLIDALDECLVDLPKLLRFISQQSTASSRVKWIISSRNWPDIEDQLERAGHKIKLSLELNADSISTAVSTYIQHKVLELAQIKKYSAKTQTAVLEYLSRNSNNTFLWAALVCQNLDQIRPLDTLERLNEFPPGLDSLYHQMLQQLRLSYRADLCKCILATMAVVYRPVTLHELKCLVDMPDHIADDLESVMEIIRLCGSFLTVRNGAVYFVHQSAKDFLLEEASDEIFPTGLAEVHYSIMSRSLRTLSLTLQRDMYSLRALGYPIDKVKQPDPDPLAKSRYACVFWIDHLSDWFSLSCADPYGDLQAGGTVEVFIKEKYLYWLEALSLCKSMSEGVVLIEKLEALLQVRADAPELLKLIHDARRFILYHKVAIENNPLQAYASTLMFSPTRSLIRKLFRHEEPTWVTIRPAIGDKWSACLATLEGHSDGVCSVAFSHDGTRLASASARSPSHTTGPGSHRRRGTGRSRSGTPAAARVYKRYILAHHSL
ncbi:HET-domain-containing protein [Tothia fuscella]|uniref:HET-domain-containing protein n=1 Tax=Tothia fuscella TaxID=1048955 RepID=A0A9P4NXN5_9PEZI|nr:HET-domain-containing protein [Tothia fuscella]